MSIVGHVQRTDSDTALPPGVTPAEIAAARRVRCGSGPFRRTSSRKYRPWSCPASRAPSYRAAPIEALNVPLPPLTDGLMQPYLPPLPQQAEAPSAATTTEPDNFGPPTASRAGRASSLWDRDTKWAVLIAAILVVAFTAWMVRSRWSQRTASPDASGGASASNVAGVPAVAPDKPAPDTPSPAKSSAQAPAAKTPEKPVATTPALGIAEPTARAGQSPVASKEKPGPVVPVKVSPARVDPAKVAPAKVDAAKVEPARVDPERQAAFRRQIVSARAAMSRRDPAASRRLLAAARKDVQTPDEEAEVTRLESLTGKLDEFWKAMSRLLAEQMPAQEITVGDKPMIVVESGKNLLTLRYEARSVRYTLKTLPRSVVEAIAREGLDLAKDPSSLVLLGTFLAFDPQGDRRLARQLWQNAAQQGHDVSDLMPELDR